MTIEFELMLLILCAVFSRLHWRRVGRHVDAAYACRHHHLHLHAGRVPLCTTFIAFLLAFCFFELPDALTRLTHFLACCSVLVHHGQHRHHVICRAAAGLLRLVNEAIQLLPLFGDVRYTAHGRIARDAAFSAGKRSAHGSKC